LKTSNYDEEKFLCQQLPLAGITHKGGGIFLLRGADTVVNIIAIMDSGKFKLKKAIIPDYI